MLELTRADILAKIMSVEGGISENEAFLLFEEAQKVRDGCIVEIGAHRGRSTAALALGSQAAYNVPVYVIEPHEQFAGILGGKFGSADRVQFMRNMLKLDVVETIRLVNLSSEFISSERWPDAVALLWIDGDHKYTAVRRDVCAWLPHLRPDATILFHDATDTRIGPIHVVRELRSTGEWENCAPVDNIAVLRKTVRER